MLSVSSFREQSTHTTVKKETMECKMKMDEMLTIEVTIFGLV